MKTKTKRRKRITLDWQEQPERYNAVIAHTIRTWQAGDYQIWFAGTVYTCAEYQFVDDGIDDSTYGRYVPFTTRRSLTSAQQACYDRANR